MVVDDPTKPEFASPGNFGAFARRVPRGRFVWERKVQAFVDTVCATIDERETTVPKGKIFFRAQHGIRQAEQLYEDGSPADIVWEAHEKDRMKPLKNRAREGRVNPAGIPILYLASKLETAISEVRPWIGSKISVFEFRTTRELKAINLTAGHGSSSSEHVLFELPPGADLSRPDTKERAVWIDIDSAFSRPVTPSDDTAEYLPTQILADVFRGKGYDAVLYRSYFGEKGMNVALFNDKDAEPVEGTPYRVTKIEMKFMSLKNSPVR